jgi:hypothetical protein
VLIDADGRAGSCGEWHSATARDGTRVGALRIDPELLAVPGALDRLLACVEALRSADLDGVLPIADLIQRPASTGDDIWLIASGPATPTLADLAPGPDAAALLHDVGESLLALHAAGMTHGALSSSTVVAGPDARPRLIEVGLRAALTAIAVDPADDVRQWVQLGRALATAGGGTLLARCAEIAETESLAAAVAALAEPAVLGPAPAAQDSGRTRLGRRGTTASRAEDRPAGELIRFGPGVPSISTSPAEQARVGAVRPARQRARRRIVSALLTIAVITGVALWWWHRLGGLGVESASVHAEPSVAGCATTIDVVGVIATNGRRGTIHYQWRRNDGQPTSQLSQDMLPGDHSASVHLAWTFAGQGDFDAVATLEVLSPQSLHAVGRFSYHC